MYRSLNVQSRQESRRFLKHKARFYRSTPNIGFLSDKFIFRWTKQVVLNWKNDWCTRHYHPSPQPFPWVHSHLIQNKGVRGYEGSRIKLFVARNILQNKIILIRCRGIASQKLGATAAFCGILLNLHRNVRGLLSSFPVLELETQSICYECSYLF